MSGLEVGVGVVCEFVMSIVGSLIEFFDTYWFCIDYGFG